MSNILIDGLNCNDQIDEKFIIKICPSCNLPFKSLRSKNKKYCSQKCNSERNENYMMYRCDYCGKEIRIKKSVYQEKLDGKRQHIYCSVQCSNNDKRTGYDITCDYCGKIFYRRQYHIDRQISQNEHQFCSMECQRKFRHEQAYEVRVCEICNKEFQVLKKSTQRFCSIECQHVWQTTIVGELNPKFISVKVKCDYCGMDHYVRPYKLNEQDYFFCSIKCRQKWYAEIYSQTEDFKNMHRNKILNQFKSGNLQSIDSNPQRIVNGLLDKYKILYERERDFKYYAVDNYLINDNLIIEVQGDYWHANPTVFKSKLSKTQYDRIVKDKRKHSYIKNKYGIEILYLWEYDLVHHSDLCEQLILRYINQSGLLNNYHSFNYHFNNNCLLMNELIIKPYQEQNVDQYNNLLVI